MIPLAIPAISSVAGSAFDSMHNLSVGNVAGKLQSMAQSPANVSFSTVLGNVSSIAGAGQTTLSAEQMQQLAALPEVKAALASNPPGTAVNFSISAQGLSRVLPNGTTQVIALSPSSQSTIGGLTTGMNPSATANVMLMA